MNIKRTGKDLSSDENSFAQDQQVEKEYKETIHKQRLRRARIAAILISLVAIGAVFLAFYAFQQKREANYQTNLANQKALEALRQQKIAVEERNSADSNKELASERREFAAESEATAWRQKAIALAETRKAEQSQLEALQQKYLAEQQKNYGDSQKVIADANIKIAKTKTSVAEEKTRIAEKEKEESERLKKLADSRNMAKESVLLLNENRLDSSKNKVLQAYQFNIINNGPRQNNDIYNALNSNWLKTINYKNFSGLHELPVHSITGMPNSNIVFTADETGNLYKSSIINNTLQRIASYSVEEEVRALSVSPDGSKLIAITASGNGVIFNISSSDISVLNRFKFPGIGKAIAFYGSKNCIVFSSKGVGNYNITDHSEINFLDYEGISAVAVGRSGKLYIASGNQVRIYNNWNDLLHTNSEITKSLDSKITSLTVNDNEQYIAAGTYNGFVWIIDKKNNRVLWSKALHISSVTDLKFKTVDGDKIQLAAAGADQTINLIDFTAILQEDSAEDIITLKGHTQWIYSLYYTPDGQWLLSSSEDNKVIAWKPTMRDLYQTLYNK